MTNATQKSLINTNNIINLVDKLSNNIIAIVPAGGVGMRAGTNIAKQYRLINNIPMLRLTAMALLADKRINKVIVGVAKGDEYVHGALKGLERVSYTYTGGVSRAETVANTIKYALEHGFISENDWAIVHDAARPGLPVEALNRLIDKCLLFKQGGILAMPAADTVKQALPDSNVVASDNINVLEPKIDKSLDRNRIWLAQTPQMFPAADLLYAINKSIQLGFEITDEASAMEQIFSYNALLVKGSTLNLKVTWREDFDLIENLID